MQNIDKKNIYANLISIIVVNWNGIDLLSECLEALWNQTISNIEIILVDNGSTDNSVSYTRTHFPETKIIQLMNNVGFAKANNIGIRESKGKYIATINNDTKAEPNWLEELVISLNNHPEVGFCASKLLSYWNKNIIDSAGDILLIASAVNRGQYNQDGVEYSTSRYIFGACAGAAIYRRKMLDEIGLFDDNFVTNFEDVDLSFRAQLAGYKCLYVPSAIVYHKRGETIQRIESTIDQFSFRNKKILWIKNAPLEIFIKYLPGFLLPDIAFFLKIFGVTKHGFRIPKPQLLPKFILTYLELIYLLPYILNQRKIIQKNRKVSWKYIETLMFN